MMKWWHFISKGQIHCDIIIFSEATPGHDSTHSQKQKERLGPYFLWLDWLAEADKSTTVILVDIFSFLWTHWSFFFIFINSSMNIILSVFTTWFIFTVQMSKISGFEVKDGTQWGFSFETLCCLRSRSVESDRNKLERQWETERENVLLRSHSLDSRITQSWAHGMRCKWARPPLTCSSFSLISCCWDKARARFMESSAERAASRWLVLVRCDRMLFSWRQTTHTRMCTQIRDSYIDLTFMQWILNQLKSRKWTFDFWFLLLHTHSLHFKSNFSPFMLRHPSTSYSA